MLLSATPGSLSWPAALVVWGPGYWSSLHKHHSIQLVLALQGSLRVRGGPGQPWLTCGAALVQPDALHEVEARDATVLISFVDPESELAAALVGREGRAIAAIEARQVARWRARLGDPATLDAGTVEAWLRSELLSGRQPNTVHPRVQRVLRFLRERLAEVDEAHSLDRLAVVAGLSPSRLMHAFTASLGVPLRPYIRWLRLQRALGELMGGATVTQAAHTAGFSDAAHLSRTVRRMLGSTPTELVKRRSRTRGVQLGSA
jgi:AraC-like DNA-binding protein